MSKFFNKQRHQQQSSDLTLGLFVSILIHALVALALSRRQSPQLQTDKSTPIIIVEQQTQLASGKDSRSRSGEGSVPPSISSQQSQPKAKPITPIPKTSQAVKTTPTPPLKAKPTFTKTISNSSPKPPEFPPKVKSPVPATPKSDSPLLTSSQTLKKLPKIVTQSKVEPEIEKLIEENEVNKSENSEIVTKPGLNSNQAKPITSAQNKPASSEFKQESNPVSTSSINADRPLNSSENSQETTQANNFDTSTKGKDEAQTAANTTSNKPELLSISCEENCQPEYPSALNGAEGSAGIKLTIDREGNVIDAAIASSNGHSQLDEEALKAARSMEFSSIDHDSATVRINISFTIAGSDFERQAREEQESAENSPEN
ncbi:MAG: TonB family protein [Hyellaceae cyanobacterium CSU_1_1]|nr:TonB family protein [Pleurocapsa sp. CRU_1_2]NJR46041.1 TonB family protein [Hyellaceae cyanobacterium CSU_1_1]